MRGGAARTPGRAGAGHAARTTGRYLLAMSFQNSATHLSSMDSSPGSERTNPSRSVQESIRSRLRSMALIGLRAETRELVKLSLLKDQALNSLTYHTKMGLRHGHPDADFFRPAGTPGAPYEPSPGEGLAMTEESADRSPGAAQAAAE